MKFKRLIAGILLSMLPTVALVLAGAPGGLDKAIGFISLPYEPGQATGANVPLFSLAAGDRVQQFAATPDLKAYALVLAGSKVKAHAGSGKDAGGAARVVLNGKVLGSFSAVAPASLRISEDGASVAFTIVLWRTWTPPLYWIARNGQKFSSAGVYTEDIEFRNLAAPWISPDGSKIAYLISVKGKKRVMIDENRVFEGKEADLSNPWSKDGKHFAFVTRKKGQDRLIVDGQIAASSTSVRLIMAPSTYILGDGTLEQLVVEGKPCFSAASILDVVFAEKGGGAAVAFSDGHDRLKVALLTGDCKTQSTLGEGKDWRGIKALQLSADGKTASFGAVSASGVTEAQGPAAGAPPPCSKAVIMGSVTIAPGGKSASWIAGEGKRHRLCAAGKDLGTWDRIELPLRYEEGGGALSFFFWKDSNLLKETLVPKKSQKPAKKP